MEKINTCLILYGQARHIKECGPSIKKLLMEPNDITDVYCHTWNPSMSGKYPHYQRIASENIADIVEIYNPKEMVVEKPFQFRRLNWGGKDIHLPLDCPQELYAANALQSMFYSRYRAGMLISEFADYKQYIYCRTDLLFEKDYYVYDIEDYDIIAKAGNKHPIHDWIFICGKQAFKWMRNAYMYMDQIYSIRMDRTAETYHEDLCTYFGLKLIRRYIGCQVYQGF